MRETAKWIVTVFGSFGVVLVAGTHLSHIGRLDLQTDGPRALVAAVAIIAALSAIGWTVWAATEVHSAGEVTLADIDARQDRGEIDWLRSHDLLAGFSTMSEFRAYRESDDPQPPRSNKDRGQRRASRAQAEELAYLRTYRLLSGARFYRVREKFNRARVAMFSGGAVAALSAVTFVWAVNPPAPPASGTGPIPFTIPASGEVVLSAAGRELLSRTLGEKCTSAGRIRVIVVDDSKGAPDVISVPSHVCPASRFSLAEPLGVLVANQLPQKTNR